MPIVSIIRETGILSEFPTKTEGDLYLWVLDHQRYLAEEGQALQPPEAAALNFKEAIKKGKTTKGRKSK